MDLGFRLIVVKYHVSTSPLIYVANIFMFHTHFQAWHIMDCITKFLTSKRIFSFPLVWLLRRESTLIHMAKYMAKISNLENLQNAVGYWYYEAGPTQSKSISVYLLGKSLKIKIKIHRILITWSGPNAKQKHFRIFTWKQSVNKKIKK